jgi:transporter family-2 protein
VSKLLVLLAVLGVGALLAAQPPINSQLSRHVGTLGAAFVSLSVSAAIVGVLLVASGGLSGLSSIGGVPPLYLTGGIVGAANVTVALIAVRTLGAGGVVAVTVATQLVASLGPARPRPGRVVPAAADRLRAAPGRDGACHAALITRRISR